MLEIIKEYIEHNKKRTRYNVGDRVRISKFKNIFTKGYTPNWSREIFINNKINDTVPYTYNLKDLKSDSHPPKNFFLFA